MDRNAVLPDRCFKCNEPADGYRRTVKLTHVPLGTEMMVGAIAYAFAKQAKVEVGLCERHRRSRAINIALVSLAVLGASIFVFTQVQATDVVLPLLATAGLIGGVIGLLYAAVGTRLVRATQITDTHVWLKGAGEPFLASLPDAPAVGAGGRFRPSTWRPPRPPIRRSRPMPRSATRGTARSRFSSGAS